MAQRDRPHLLVRTPAVAEAYRAHPRSFGGPSPRPPTDPVAHARALSDALRRAAAEAVARRGSAGVSVGGAEPGVYVEFEGVPGFDLKLESLENKRKKIELVAVRDLRRVDPISRTEVKVQHAAAFVPDGSVEHFLDRFDQYATKTTATGKREHKPMVERLAALRLASLRALWTDAEDAFPAPDACIWWEVWLRRHDGQELARLHEFAGHRGLDIAERRLEFPDRIVTLVRGTGAALSMSLDVMNDLAEVRRAKLAGDIFAKMHNREQRDWVDELAQRSQLPSADAPAVCILDTGVNRAHPLLEQALAADDVHACDPRWGTHDHHGHGTEMAGLALYGDLAEALASSHPIRLRHRLESVKILPPAGQNAVELWGNITADAASRAEIQAPSRRRTFSLSVASKDTRDQGRPTSWSAAVDALAAGRSFEPTTHGLVYLDESGVPARRLFVLSAGNVDTTDIDHLSRSDSEPVHDPGQAWNALTVGAFTERAEMDLEDASLSGHEPLAAIGELSPYSSTSVPFARQWPLKPDVVAEGGNKAVEPGGRSAVQVDCLSLLTTYHDLPTRLLGTTCATSAAAAQVSRIAGEVSAEYPSFWPETVRGLIVSSARWSKRMQARLDADPRRTARLNLVRRYGFGVPSLARALRSAKNALTLIVQDEIHPFRKGALRELHLHELPWPMGALAGLGEQPVVMRVTLSYFVEPNPGQRGWQRRHSYASHGLRFDLRRATDSEPEFRKHLNRLALEEDEERPARDSDSAEWFVGPKERYKGSLHHDIWTGTAADLARRGSIGIVPVSGWWKHQPVHDRSDYGARYALIISIEPEEIDLDIDIWTPVAQAVGVAVTTEVGD